ncbi:9982_t:CDS:2, partial [Ambispora leptoticha]
MWTVNIEHATLEALKDSIRAVYQTPALENDGAVFNVVCDSGKYSPRNDQALREMLRLLDTTESSTRKAPKKPVRLWETFFTEAFNA